jgi:hypothetical protein
MQVAGLAPLTTIATSPSHGEVPGVTRIDGRLR